MRNVGREVQKTNVIRHILADRFEPSIPLQVNGCWNDILERWVSFLDWTATIVVSWAGAAGVVLQSATNLTETAWQTMPETAGQSSAVLPASAQARFYRLTKL